MRRFWQSTFLKRPQQPTLLPRNVPRVQRSDTNATIASCRPNNFSYCISVILDKTIEIPVPLTPYSAETRIYTQAAQLDGSEQAQRTHSIPIRGVEMESIADERPIPAYIVQNKLTHLRLLPKESTHTFVYATPYLLASLNALESKALDLGHGWLFGYGGVAFRVTGMREATYLQPASFSGQTIKQKIEVLLERKGYDVQGKLEDVWTLSMPAYFGYDGMNPLTVYFAYKKDGSPWLVILEIHNTFYERHTHILEVNEQSKVEKKGFKGYDYHWFFPREFHVSPFNDRSGFYGISVVLPFSTLPSPSTLPTLQPRARVRVDLHTVLTSTPPTPGPIKLVALIDPLASAPFTSPNLVRALAKQPLVLFRAWSRILYNAWILHYVKRLDVFQRPEPKPAVPDWSYEEHTVAGGVGWQEETWTEAFARKRVEAVLRRRVEELGVEVMLKPANPAVPTQHFALSAGKDLQGFRTLVISHMSSTVFSTLFFTPSAAHALLMGKKEKQFAASSEELFLEVFGGLQNDQQAESDHAGLSLTQRWRAQQIPPSVDSAIRIPIPHTHMLDSTSTFMYLFTLFVLLYISVMDRFTELMYKSLGARFVKGQEPWSWRVWERTAGKGEVVDEYMKDDLVEREGGADYMLGSVRTVAS